MNPPASPGAREWIPAATSGLLVILLAGAFLPHQCLWVDETTQMKGLTLAPGELIRWLAGADQGRFGVPGDRMPPLSYLVGKAWAALFGLNESALRWMGVFLVAAAAAVVARTARPFAGTAGSFIAGTIFALSANVITWAVEIRAYPLFLLTSACAFLAFSRIVSRPAEVPVRWIVILAGSIVASMYTHFYGVFLAFGLGAASLWSVWRNRGPLRPLAAAFGVAALLSAGLLPFLTASASMSPGVESGGSGLRDLVRLLYRLFSHPAISISLVAAAFACLGMAGLFIPALLSKTPQTPAVRHWALAIALGFGATVAGSLFVRGFNVFTPSYSSWVLPGLAVLASMAWISRERVVRSVALGALCLLVAGQAYGAVQIVTKGPLFAHGPHRSLEALVRKHESAGLAILHESDAFGPAYFPLFYEFGSGLKQFALLSERPLRVAEILPGGLEPAIDIEALKAPRVIVVRVEWLGARDLRLEAQGHRPPLPPGPIAEFLSKNERWKLLESHQVAATAGAAVHVYGR